MKDLFPTIEMTQVGELGKIYKIPTEVDDSGIQSVTGGFGIAKSLTTYDLWYQVRRWSLFNGYNITAAGLNKGASYNFSITKYPIYPGRKSVNIYEWPWKLYHERVSKNSLVYNISWRHIIVWCNALSEMKGFRPVYRTEDGTILRDSSDIHSSILDNAIQSKNNGYRLPTSFEWEMAARWKNDTISTNGSIFVGERYWTPGNYASGAIACVDDVTETKAVSVCEVKDASQVRTLRPNHLGLYDMSGSFYEFVFDKIDDRPIIRGGFYLQKAKFMTVGHLQYVESVETPQRSVGFRLARDGSL